MAIPDFLSLDDLERAAALVLPTNTYDFYRSGARDERTLAANRAAWDSWWFVPRVLTGTGDVSLATSVLGQALDCPVLVAPMSVQKLAHPEGEAAVTRATAAAGTINIVSQGTMTSLEEIAAVPGARFWAQHYSLVDRDVNERIIRSAVAAGAGAIVWTVDAPIRTSGRAHPRGGFIWPPEEQLAIPHEGSQAEVTIRWEYVGWLREVAGLPIVLKGILHPDDARQAVDQGCAAIIVSNHGGRTLDGTVATAEVLPEIAEAVGAQIELYVDGGIRRGSDVLKALALGARAVLVGRPILWGLAYAGEEGVSHVLRTLRTELAVDAALCGLGDVTAIPEGLVRRVGY